MSEQRFLGPGQLGTGDMEPEEFRAAAHRVVDRVADYLAGLERQRVVPLIEPGAVRQQIPPGPPADPEPLETILSDYAALIEPNITHWQHPGFMAYFTSIACGPGILGEWLATALNSNVMFWRNAPASTELEERVVQWLRQMLGLPDGFDGMFTDTASVSSLLSLVAARHAIPGLDTRERGLTATGTPRLSLYCSTEAHMSIEKAAVVIGIGREGVRKIPVDDELRLRVDLLEQAIAEDRRAGWLPFCVVGVLGTTGVGSVDPADALADVCRREDLWLHLDAAYAGTAALAPELREHFRGWERADSLVVNPHKWMWTPFDASLLLFRDGDVFRKAFSVVPEYLRASQIEGAHNYNEYGIQMGRRFRALKLWTMIRYFGADGMAARVRRHVGQARQLAAWIEADDDWSLVAPAHFSLVCCRYQPVLPDDSGLEQRLDAWNREIVEEVNRAGRFYLSATVVDGRAVIRIALGNLRATDRHVAGCWEALRQAAATVRRTGLC